MKYEQITYDYFCSLGGLSNPRCDTRLRFNGEHSYTVYYYATSGYEGEEYE